MLWLRLLWLKFQAESDSPERKTAIKKLANSGDARALGTLVKVALTDESTSNRKMAIQGLKNIHDPKAGRFLAAALRHESLRENASTALLEMTGWAMEPLIELLRDDDPGTRQAAVQTLVGLGPIVASSLQLVVQDGSAVARQAADQALRQLNTPEDQTSDPAIGAETE